MIKGLVIPSFVDGNQWAACFGLSWTDMMMTDQASAEPHMVREGGMYLREVAGTMGVAEARNNIVKVFLETTRGEWLFMVDTDMGFAPDTVERLVARAEANRVQVMGALAFALKGKGHQETELHARRYKIQPTMYRYVDTGTEKGFLAVDTYERDAVQFVDGTGAACLLMHREALQAIGPDPFRPMIVRGANPDGSDRAFSEDLSFCARAAGAGVAIAVDTAVKTTHYKVGIYLDEETWLAQQAVSQASPLGVTPDHLNDPVKQSADMMDSLREVFG